MKCKCDDCIKEFIATVFHRITKYSPHNTDIFYGFHRGRELALDILLEVTREFFGDELTTDMVHALVIKRLEETK